MKPASTIILTDTERTTLSKFLNVKTHTEFPKQQSEKFSRICNMLDNIHGKKEFTVAEFKMIKKEVKIAAAIINKKQAQCNYWEREEMNKELMFFMANVSRDRSGLKMNIWISPGICRCKPRIYVQLNYENQLSADTFSVSIEDAPKVYRNSGEMKKSDIQKIKQFIILNKQLLLDHWNGKEVDIVSVIKNLKKA